MASAKNVRPEYSWMLKLSSEGWAWEFLRRNPEYRRDFVAYARGPITQSSEAAGRWGLLGLIDPDIDARSAPVFWHPDRCQTVLQLVTDGERSANGLSGLKCKTSELTLPGASQLHVLFSSEGLFLQLAITGRGAITRSRYMLDALSEGSGDGKLIALRRLNDLLEHKRLRPQLYSRQRRGPRLAHVAEVLDSYARNPAHRSIASDVFGKTRAEDEWDNLRDHVRRAVTAGKKLTQMGYLAFLG